MNFKEYFKKENIKQQFSQKSFRLGGYSALASLIIVAIAVVAVMTVDSVSPRYTKLDMTNTSLYSLSEASINTAKAADKEVTMYLLAPNGSEDAIILNMLEKYAGYNDKIKVELKDPIIFPNFAKNYTDEQIQANAVIVVCGEKSRYIAYSDIYKTTTDYSTYAQTTEYDGENKITSALNYVVNDDLPKLYMLTGHGEMPMASGMQDALSSQNIELIDTNLLTMADVPEDADCILINNPTSDISANEKDIILKYLKNGGKMMVVTGYTGVDMPVLNELMSNYGVKGENKLIFEGNTNNHLSGYNHYLIADMESHEITTPLTNAKYNTLLPLVHPITKTEGYAGSATVTDILTTSPDAYTKVDAYNKNTVEKEATDETGEYSLGVVITDTAQNGETKIVWVSSAQLLDDNMNQIVSGGNQDLFLNSVNWMCEREESIAIHPKSLANDTLTVTEGASKIWTFVFVFLIPALFVVFGIIVKIKRKKN